MLQCVEHLRRLLVILLEWVSLALGVFVASKWGLLAYDDLAALAAVILTMGVLNSFVRPLVLGVYLIVSLPVLILTLGLAYYLVVLLANGTVLYLADQILSSFKVTHWALATLCISIVSWLLTSALGIEQVKPWRRPPKKGPDDAIDV
ncbi:MAG: phage holin family protein [Opitutia bacterium]|jgi:uncharacterized membrane protein YvlD (DUF360 family)